MGLETVKQEILDNAKRESNSLLAEARKESDRILKETDKKIEELMEKNSSEIKKIIDTIKMQESASGELESKKMLLEARKQVIDKVFTEARKRLERLDSKTRETYMKKLLKKTKSEIEPVHFYCNKKDTKFLKEFDVESVSIAGGLMAENKEKNIRVDHSFETLLETIKETEMQNISKLLFG